MKKILILILTVVSLSFSNFIYAEDMLGPVPEGGKLVENNPGKQIFIYDSLSLDEINSFYKDKFSDDNTKSWQKPLTDLPAISISDWGNDKWHNITAIDKGNGIELTVMKDSWTWIIGSLVIRFVGVLIILVVLMAFLYLSGKIFSIKKAKKEEAQTV